jgi:hypothetical protein
MDLKSADSRPGSEVPSIHVRPSSRQLSGRAVATSGPSDYKVRARRPWPFTETGMHTLIDTALEP